MLSMSPEVRNRRPLLFALFLATLLAAVLRVYGITGQVVIDDEWHAIHKLASSGWENIFRSFGLADHSIPLTLLYKAMAATVGLAEGRLRLPQIACGIALVPVAGWLAWRAWRDAPQAALFAFLVAGAPFLTMWSRFARPYAMTPLLALVAVACIWHWRTHRTRRVMAAAAISSALLAWFHPLGGIYPAIACIFVFIEDVAAGAHVRPRPSRASFKLGVVVAASMLLLLVVPLLRDFSALRGKAGGDQPDWQSVYLMLGIFWGGLPPAAFYGACALAVGGFVAVWRRDARFAAFLALLASIPPAAVALLGAHWVHSGQNLGRYVLPLQLIVLFLGSVGAVSLVRAVARGRAEAAAWGAVAVLATGYLCATPTIRQVATLGTWYAHTDYHWDYLRSAFNETRRDNDRYSRPAFYRDVLERAPAGSVPVIEAPYIWEGPYNSSAYYAMYHHQPLTFGFIHDLCRSGQRIGETPPWDRRFRFRKFVHLHDVQGVKRSGARYLLFHRKLQHGRPFPEAETCRARLEGLYGAPIAQDERLAVFDLAR